MIKKQQIRLIYSTSPFIASHVAAVWLKARFGLPWVADFQDPIVDNPFRNRRWPYPYDELMERILFRQADRLLANTDTVAAVWSERYPQWKCKISVLWNSFDPAEQMELKPSVRREHRVIAHIGSLYGDRHPGKLLAIMERLSENHPPVPPVRVQLVGRIEGDVLNSHGSMFDRLVQKGLLEFENELVPRQAASQAMADADFLLLLDLNSSEASFQLPSKLLDYIRIGRPILAFTSKDSPVERILERAGILHLCISPKEPDGLAAEQISKFLSLPTQRREPSAWFCERFNCVAQARIVSGLFDELLSRG
jgi:glycosyltransferase involved in cell wall biosynthesis